MKATTWKAALGSAALLLLSQPCDASSHGHHHAHLQLLDKKHGHVHSHSSSREAEVVERSGQCAFPSGEGMVAITPDAKNAGWAMSPDEACLPGNYCPIACPPGQVMNQWKPGTTYTYPESQYGGLYCDSNGAIQKPFPSNSYCKDGTMTVQALNTCGSVVAFCQTVLPGNEAMLIPTEVKSSANLAVPDHSYWDSTASHFYINPPGYSVADACIWGTDAKPIGNWAPFVAGANTDASGSTYVKLGINPVWQSSGLSSTKPTFGLKIDCPNGGCNGLPCGIDGSGVTSPDKSSGAGGSDFCVVTVPKGGSANIVIYNLDGSTGSSGSSSSAVSSAAPTSSATAATPTTSSSPTSTSTVAHATTSSSVAVLTTSSQQTSSSVASSSSLGPQSTSTSSYALGGIFQENGTYSSSYTWASRTASETSSSAAGPTSSGGATATKSEATVRNKGGAAMVGLVIALVAAGFML